MNTMGKKTKTENKQTWVLWGSVRGLYQVLPACNFTPTRSHSLPIPVSAVVTNYRAGFNPSHASAIHTTARSMLLVSKLLPRSFSDFTIWHDFGNPPNTHTCATQSVGVLMPCGSHRINASIFLKSTVWDTFRKVSQKVLWDCMPSCQFTNTSLLLSLPHSMIHFLPVVCQTGSYGVARANR